MLILAFETSAKAASVALMDGERLLAQSYQNTAMTHSQTLLVMAQELLRRCAVDPGAVEAVAVAAGPGSFTGVRIGVAAAKGFAWGRQIPCCGVSTLEAMALTLGVSDGLVCPVMDARRSQVYNALFQFDCGKCTRIREDRAISIQDLVEDVQKMPGPIFLVGDGSVLCYNTMSEKIPSLVLPVEHRMHQQAVGVGILASRKLAQGAACDAGALTPNYLRLSQAERERLERSREEKNVPAGR